MFLFKILYRPFDQFFKSLLTLCMNVDFFVSNQPYFRQTIEMHFRLSVRWLAGALILSLIVSFLLHFKKSGLIFSLKQKEQQKEELDE